MAHQPAHWPHDPNPDDPPVGVSIRPLHQLPDLGEAAPTIPEGVPSNGWDRGGVYGTAGGSALAHYQQARNREWATFVRTLPWRLATVIAAGALAGTITLAVDGTAWHNGHPLDQTLATVRWEAQQLAGALGAPVLPLLCVHDTRIPWDEVYVEGVPVLTPARVLALLRSLEAHMDPAGVMLLAEHARHQLRPAA